MITVIAKNECERDALYKFADETGKEFHIALEYAPYFKYGLVSDAKRRGHDADLGTPRGTLEVWAEYVTFEEFMERHGAEAEA